MPGEKLWYKPITNEGMEQILAEVKEALRRAEDGNTV